MHIKIALKMVVIISLLLFIATNSYSEKILIISKGKKIPKELNGSNEGIFSSLQEAHDFIYDEKRGLGWSNLENIKDDVTIYVLEGEYFEKGLLWKASSSNYKIKITNYKKEKAIFNGSKKDGTFYGYFFRLQPSCSRENKSGITNLTINGLIIKNYYNGIVFGKASNTCANSNDSGHNIISSNTFQNIGNKIVGTTKEFNNLYSNNQSTWPIGYAAISLNRSSNNIISDNYFLNIENSYKQGLVHSIYLNDNSKNNKILNNQISYCSGTPINIRNGSNNNFIEGNRFKYSANIGSMIYIWHCDSSNNDCNGRSESPSIGTAIKNNKGKFHYPYRYKNYENRKVKIFDSYIEKDIQRADDLGRNKMRNIIDKKLLRKVK